MNKSHALRIVKHVELRDIVIAVMQLGARTIRGTLWPGGEHFAATLFAISGTPGGDGKKIIQVAYTDRGNYRTNADLYGISAWYVREPASFNGRTSEFESDNRGSIP